MEIAAAGWDEGSNIQRSTTAFMPLSPIDTTRPTAAAAAMYVSAVNVCLSYAVHKYGVNVGVPWQHPHRRSGLMTLPFVRAVP